MVDVCKFCGVARDGAAGKETVGYLCGTWQYIGGNEWYRSEACELRCSEKRIAELERANATLVQTLSSHDAEIAIWTKKARDLEDKLAHMRDCHDIQQKTIHARNDEIRRLNGVAEDMTQRNKHLQQAVDYNVAKINTLADDSAIKIAEIKRLDGLVNDHREEGKTVRAHLAAAEAAKDYWHKASIAKEEEIVELKKRRGELAEANMRQAEMIERMDKASRQLLDSNTCLQKDRQALHDQLHAVQRPLVEENAKLVKQVANQREQIGNIYRRIQSLDGALKDQYRINEGMCKTLQSGKDWWVVGRSPLTAFAFEHEKAAIKYADETRSYRPIHVREVADFTKYDMLKDMKMGGWTFCAADKAVLETVDEDDDEDDNVFADPSYTELNGLTITVRFIDPLPAKDYGDGWFTIQVAQENTK